MKLSSTAIFTTLAYLTTTAIASPADKEGAYVTSILYPKAETVWRVGSRHNVTWSTAESPATSNENDAFVYLAQDEIVIESGPGSYSEPLALGINLSAGRVNITVPNVHNGSNYQILLKGDSKNFSEKFTIVQID